MGGEMMKSGLHLAKRESEGITSCFIATRTNLISLYSLAQAGGMESVGSQSISLKPHVPNLLLYERREGGLFRCGTTVGA